MSPSFRHRHRVTYSECTIGNNVYYARYLDILEAARGEFFRSLGATFTKWQESEVIFQVVEANVKYRAAARYDDELEVEVWVSELGRTRIGFGYSITRAGGERLFEGTTTHVTTDLGSQPRRVPEELATMLKPHLREPPAVGAG